MVRSVSFLSECVDTDISVSIMSFAQKLLPRGGLTRYAILSVLKDSPTHGYDIIAQIEKRTKGLWRPSPGSVYPTLKELAEEGHLSKVEGDRRDVYQITDKGLEELSRLELREGRILDTASKIGEVTVGVFLGSAGIFEKALEGASQACEKVIHAIDERSSLERRNLLKKYGEFLKSQLDAVEKRLRNQGLEAGGSSQP
jgi:DNA-binding PadR family transcriptional regulator